MEPETNMPSIRNTLAAFPSALALLFGAGYSTAGTPSASPSMAPADHALSELEASVAGTWLGEFAPLPGMPLQRFVMTLMPDGSFTTRANTYEREKLIGTLNNSGLWGASNGLFFTITLAVDEQRTDTRWPSVVNPYLIQRVMSDTFIYRHIPSGNVFSVRRVPADYALPPGRP